MTSAMDRILSTPLKTFNTGNMLGICHGLRVLLLLTQACQRLHLSDRRVGSASLPKTYAVKLATYLLPAFASQQEQK